MRLNELANMSAARTWSPWRAFPKQLVRAALSLALLFLVFEGATAEGETGREPPYNSAELEQQAAEWDTFNSRVEQELRLLSDRGLLDKDALNLAPPKSSKWWDEQGTAGKALRARIVQGLQTSPLMEGASDLNLWLVLALLEGGARLRAKAEGLEAKFPNNAPFAKDFGPGGLFSISVGLQKRLFDPITGLRGTAYADHRGGGYSSFGSGSPEYVRSVLADHLDRFIADYLRVNADACGGLSELTK